MFPGQPLTREPVPSSDADFSELSRLVLHRTGLDLASLTWAEAPHSEQVALQVSGVFMSLHKLRCLLSTGVQPDIIAEHSLGIYAALAACGSVSEGDALEMAFRAGVCMEHSFVGEDYSLCCITGLTEQPLAAICRNNGVHIANFNTSRHFLISGRRTVIEAACEEARQAGAFSAATFTCDAPLHTPLVENIASALLNIFSDYNYREEAVPVLEHLEQKRLASPQMAKFLTNELCRPVYWEKTYRALLCLGVTNFYETGSGLALTKFNRWIDSGN